MPSRSSSQPGPWLRRTCLGLAVLSAWGPATGGSRGEAPRTPGRWTALADQVFQPFTLAQGLPQQIATALAEDGQGFLWVGTQGGLARWDGYRFRVYKPDPGRPGALPDGYVRTLHTDTRGRLWVGTSGAGLARYDPETDRFVTLAAGPDGLSHVFVRALADDGAGGLWVGTDGGLDHLDPDHGRVRHYHPAPGAPGGLPQDRVPALLHDTKGRLWVGTGAGLARFDPSADRFVPVPLPGPGGPGPTIGALWEDGQGRIWIGTSGAGAFLLDPATGRIQPLREAAPTGATIATERIFAIAGTGRGEVWIGTLSQGILAVDEATLATRRIQHDDAVPTSLPNMTIWALHRDRAGLLWVGTGEGLGRTDPAQQAVLTVFGREGRDRGISDPDLWAVQPMRDGRIWLGLGSHGVEVLDPERGRVAAWRPDPRRPETALPRDQILAIAGRADGEVFLGTQRGLYRVGGPAGALRRLRFGTHPAAASVDAMLLDGDHLWVGSWVDGLWRLDLSAGPSRAPVLPVGLHLAPEAFTDRRINALAVGPDGALWLGTARGLNRLDPRTGRVERIAPEAGDPKGLSVGTLTCLAFDPRGRLWVGMLGGGIEILEGRDGSGRPRFRRIGPAEGLPNENVDKLLLGSDGRMWASTDQGLAAVDPASLGVEALTAAEGVHIPAYWGNSGAATEAGELLFGGGGGLTIVRPGRRAPWSYRPPVVVTEARVGGRLVPASRLNAAGILPPLAVPAQHNSFALEFSALDFSAPGRNRYAYRLEGYDREWQETDAAHRVAAYTNLPPGTYTLRIRGSNRAGLWSDQDLRVPIQVFPAWYQTWAFRAFELLAGAAALYALLRGRVRHLEARSRELERQVADRTRALAQANDELRAANETIRENARLQAQVERMSRHDLKTPLNSIIAIPQLLLERGDLDPRDAELLGIVAEAGRRVLRMVNLSLGLFRIERGTYEFHPVTLDLERLLQRILLDLGEQARAKDVRFRIERAEGPEAPSPCWVRAEDLLTYSMFGNLLKNALEAAPTGTTVRIRLEAEDGEWQVRIHNEAVVPEAIRDRFFEKYGSVGKAGGTGLGNHSARLMAEAQQGRIGMETAEGRGTTVWVALKRALAGEAPSASPEPGGAPAPAAGRVRHLGRVLVVDDDPANRALLAQFLEGACDRIETAVNGLEALARIDEAPPELVLLDLEMPLLDGLGAVHRIRAHARAEVRACTAVALSSHDEAAIREKALAAGFDAYLTKPCTKTDLLAALAQILPEAPGAASSPHAVTLERDLEELLPGFLESRRALWSEMREALARKDFEELRRLAHLLRGGFNMYGFAYAGSLGHELEEAARQRDAVLVEDRLQALRTHLDHLDIRFGEP